MDSTDLIVAAIATLAFLFACLLVHTIARQQTEEDIARHRDPSGYDW